MGVLLWLKTAWEEWRQAWRDVRKDSRCGETILVPLDEYCVLLGAADREKVCHIQLGEAQETIRLLRATIAQQQLILDGGEKTLALLTQDAIDRRPRRACKADAGPSASLRMTSV